MRRRAGAAVFLIIVMFPVMQIEGQDEDMIAVDFRGQKVTDILLALAELCGESIIVDETVNGTATFRFADTDFESALNRFADYCRLFVEKRGKDYFVSKVFVHVNEDGTVSITAEEVMPEAIVRRLSFETKKTIVFDVLPSLPLTIRSENITLSDVLRLLVLKNPDYAVVSEGGGYYIKRDAARLNEDRALGSVRIEEAGGKYTLASQRIAFALLIDALFKKGGKEYLLLHKNASQVENIYYDNKDFDTLLRLVLDGVNADYKIVNEVYYIFEVQKRDIVKKLKETEIIKMTYVMVSELQNLLPGELNAGGFMKIDKEANTVLLTGSREEIRPIAEFLKSIDTPLEERYYRTFMVRNLPVKDAVTLVPKELMLSEPAVIPGMPAFIVQVDAGKEAALEEYLKLIDKRNETYPIHLRYIKSEELLKYLPPSAVKDSIAATNDMSLVFFTGTEEGYKKLMGDLALLDQPKQQIRYQLLVIQHQKNNNLNWNSGLAIKQPASESDAGGGNDVIAMISNLVNVNFNIVSEFGIQYAVNLNAEIGENKAKILADTTLNAISGEEISFQNTNTFRYRDVAIDAETGLYSGTTREVASGLVIQINGWVSGDGMVTVNVTAKVSKQGAVDSDSEGTTNPPSTSEKSVTTHVRTKSGQPVVIGGLLQNEGDVVEKRIPVLGAIPILGNLVKSKTITSAETELIIYLVPFVEKRLETGYDNMERIRTYYQKYVSAEAVN